MIKLEGRYSDYSIKADEKQYILIRMRTVQDGEHAGDEYEQAVGYYRTVSDALRELMRKTHRERVSDRDMTLKEAFLEYDRIENEVIYFTEQGEEV